jgi:hypothetical protein
LESWLTKSPKLNVLDKVFCRFGSNSTGSLSKKERELIIYAMKEK